MTHTDIRTIIEEACADIRRHPRQPESLILPEFFYNKLVEMGYISPKEKK